MNGGEEVDDPRLLAALEEYVAAQESGAPLNRQALLHRYPDIADELSACLQGLSFVNSAVAQIHDGSRVKSATDAQPVGELPTTQPLGDFQLVKEIGRGGMGVVYEARQLSLGRRVAVKVLPLASALDSRQLQRFRNEAQAAAQLHHTNIVPIYAVGCERSVHFYAMQLIDGLSLADVISALRAASGKIADDPPIQSPASASRLPNSSTPGRLDFSSGGLTHLHAARRGEYFKMVARLGHQAAVALDYAHQLGVVHRDIKPANLLLDHRGNLWITDFGLAQFYTDSGLTHSGDLLGTFRYMSPEQASGRKTLLDQRTDIYSLGATLYELLTLERAVPGHSREELLKQIDQVEPKPPRLIDKSIPLELQTILAKAAAKDPRDRYASAQEFANDLDRFLSDKPILAKPPTTLEKSIKWMRRHRGVTASALAMLLIVAVGLLISTVMIAREQARTKQAYLLEQRKEREASEARAEAEQNFADARRAVDFFTRIAADELPTDPQYDGPRKHLLEGALEYYQTFLDERAGNPAIDTELSATHERVARLYAELSSVDDMFRTIYTAHLLLEPTVQRELKMTGSQVSTVTYSPILDGPPGPQSALGAMTEKQRQALFSQRSAGAQRLMQSEFTAEQRTRLWQISRQMRGAAALTDPDVVQTLGLSAEQRDQLAKLIFSSQAETPRRFIGPESLSRTEDEIKLIAPALAVLTPSQRVQWNKLVGAPFATYSVGFDRPMRPGPRLQLRAGPGAPQFDPGPDRGDPPP